MDDQRMSPSRWYYALAGVVFVAGWVLFALLLIKNLSGMGAKLQQVVVPGGADITLREPGEYTIFYEYQSVVGNRVYSTEENLSGLQCELVSKAKNSKIALSPSSVNSTYELGARSGKSAFDFRIDQPGVYELSAGYPEGKQGPEVVLAVGRDFTARMLMTIFGGIALVFGSIGIAVAIALVTLIKRGKAKKQLKASHA
jgi:hypothetical protein